MMRSRRKKEEEEKREGEEKEKKVPILFLFKNDMMRLYTPFLI